jgi:serine phosphatase RsbU (regulator of sigma subunit)/anti-sigma regulatory factor (Ser/Thr protein kinase)
MSTLNRFRRAREVEEATPDEPIAEAPVFGDSVDIADDDPLRTVLLASGGPVDLEAIDVESEAVDRLREAGFTLIVPLIARGRLIGTLNLGPRLSDQPYSTDDRRLLATLADQVAPAIRVAQLVREQEAQAEERQRIEQELAVAALIQHTLLPKEVPDLPGWHIDAFYRPAREVGGDFYDYIVLDDGRVGVVIGDVTDKGVPAAMVMATCRSMLRAEASRSADPGEVLSGVNQSLVPEIPPNMFVTCLYAVIEPWSGRIAFANAGHNLPYVRTSDGVAELKATGMPLGLMLESKYEVQTGMLEPGETMLLSSDGIVEAHSASGEMYGFPRLMAIVAGLTDEGDLIDTVITDLDGFANPDTPQEDDVTLVSVRRRRVPSAEEAADTLLHHDEYRQLAAFSVPSDPGNERTAMDIVADAVEGLGFDEATRLRLGTAVSEAAMNAIEHGNEAQVDLPVDVTVRANDREVVVTIADHGGSQYVAPTEEPDLEAKLAGEDRPRGWGLFLIENMVDEVRTSDTETGHIIELVMRLRGTGS